MIREHADIAILGAGFAGSLMALILKRMGRHPVLVERGTHPRFAIGESSTPSANLALEELSRTYDLPQLFGFTEYGRWQKTYPELACGLKRGFSFYQHFPRQPFLPTPEHANEMLVAASPADEVGDTHWFREQFDYFLVQEVQKSQIPYYDRTAIATVEHDAGWRLQGRRGDEVVAIDAEFLIDATGPGGFLARHLDIPCDPVHLHTNSWSVFSHFTGVERWDTMLREMNAPVGDHPYPCDDAALHHILPDGWIWVLRFNNGVTSAGVVFDGDKRPVNTSLAPEAQWRQILHEYPSIGRQFARAEAIQPWVRTGRLQRQAKRVAGPDWAMLPHAAYFLDALFSTGIAHSLLGIERLARILQPGNEATRSTQLAEYERTLFREIRYLDWLIHGCFRTFGHFDLLGAFSMYYFAAAVQSETRRRSGQDVAGAEILFSHQDPFRHSVQNAHAHLCKGSGQLDDPVFAKGLFEQVARDIAPFNPAGFCDAAKKHMYPFVA